MGMTINSGKKIAYFDSTLEALMQCNNRIKTAVEDMRVASEAIRAAAIDRAYNCAVDMGNHMNEGIVSAGKASVEVLEDLAKLTTVGDALVSEAKRVKTTAEEVAAAKADFNKVPANVISSRGLDENWTDKTIAAFVDATVAFITARREMITTIAEITAKNSEEDFKDVYMTIGRNLEKISNETVDSYNSLKEQLDAAGNGIANAVADAAESATTIKTEGNLSSSVDLTGSVADV